MTHRIQVLMNQTLGVDQQQIFVNPLNIGCRSTKTGCRSTTTGCWSTTTWCWSTHPLRQTTKTGHGSAKPLVLINQNRVFIHQTIVLIHENLVLIHKAIGDDQPLHCVDCPKPGVDPQNHWCWSNRSLSRCTKTFCWSTTPWAMILQPLCCINAVCLCSTSFIS